MIAEPGSGCIDIKIIGIRIIKEIMNKSLPLVISVWIILRYFAKKRLVDIFTTSEGWKLKNPKIIYGGSVNPKNIVELKKISSINGFLIGGASQNSKNFIDIIKKTIN